jgi:DNA mismatch repair protein MutL
MSTSQPPAGENGQAASEKGRIRLLSDALVDQIAAGEVVERPASVVKELVENSLDAGASTIRLEVRDGGAALIAVTDDGLGMTPAELPMALQRHATSKLRSAADLQRIASFGFRGEALPAIASVSRFRIRSRARGAAHGSEIQSEAGRVLSEREAGGPEGTRIEVADLFASVPARRKFLKRPGTEWGHIADWLTRLALARPEIHIEMQRDDRPVTIWPACRDPRDRIAAVLSDDDASALIAVDHEESGCRVHGFASTPHRTRANAQALFLFVNGRPVRDRLLRHALLESYRDLLPRGRFPIAVLHIELDPELVDVNVHPAKWEVRFRQPQEIHRAIRHAIREAMASRSWLGGGRVEGDEAAASTASSEIEMRPGAPRPFGRTRHQGGDRTQTGPIGTDDWIFAAGRAGADRVAEGEPSVPGSDPHGRNALAGLSSESEGGHAGRAVDPGTRPPVTSFGGLRLIGQLKASYLLAEGDEGLVVVDQHAAHERVRYERLRRSWLESAVPRQGLLTPITVSLSASAAAAFEEAGELVDRLGFEIEPFGEEAVLVRALPAELADHDVDELVHDLAAALEEVERDGEIDESATRWLPALDRLFATLACHSARRFGDRLPEAEQRAILEGLDSIPWAPTCPHGRPVAIVLDALDLEQRFGRR